METVVPGDDPPAATSGPSNEATKGRVATNPAHDPWGRRARPNDPDEPTHYQVMDGAAERRAAWRSGDRDAYAAVLRRQSKAGATVWDPRGMSDAPTEPEPDEEPDLEDPEPEPDED